MNAATLAPEAVRLATRLYCLKELSSSTCVSCSACVQMCCSAEWRNCRPIFALSLLPPLLHADLRSSQGPSEHVSVWFPPSSFPILLSHSNFSSVLGNCPFSLPNHIHVRGMFLSLDIFLKILVFPWLAGKSINSKAWALTLCGGSAQVYLCTAPLPFIAYMGGVYSQPKEHQII